MKKMPSQNAHEDTITVSPRLLRVLDRAQLEAKAKGDAFASSSILFLQMFSEPADSQPAHRYLLEAGVTKEAVEKEIEIQRQGKKVENRREGRSLKLLFQSGRELVSEVALGKIPPVIGREDEIRSVIRILCRRTKNNPVIIGKPGVGKTAIAHLLAHRIHRGDVPSHLEGAKLLQLDVSSLLSGASHRGDLEEKMASILDQVEEATIPIILFIDEIHMICPTDNSSSSIASVLRPYLDRGGVRVLGATTEDEFRNSIEKDSIEKDTALERRFQTVYVEPPTTRQTMAVLRGLRDSYEAYHGLQIRDAALISAVELSERYVPSRNLPDKAIDLVDEATAKVRADNTSAPPELESLNQKVMILEVEIESLEKEVGVDQQLSEMRKELAGAREKRNALQGQFDAEKAAMDKFKDAKSKLIDIEAKIQDAQAVGDAVGLQRLTTVDKVLATSALSTAEFAVKSARQNSQMMKDEITPMEIAEVVAAWTGIPAADLSMSEKEKLAGLEGHLNGTVLGQERAVKAVADAIVRSRAGLSDETKPIGSFLFLGPSGVGKTWLAKCLAKIMFDDYDHVVRVDMSEYGDKHTVSRMVGAPPGYVGYEQGGQLTEAVRRRPYSIVLLDEIEKAHTEVFDVLLQLLDDGRLTDGQGRLIDFKNTVVIMTSNIGSHMLLEALERDGDITEETREKVMDLLKSKYRPELLNRIDDIAVFNPLAENNLSGIAKNVLDDIARRLKKKGIDVEFDPQMYDKVAKETYDPTVGARAIRRWTQKHVEGALANAIITAGEDAGKFTISLGDSGVEIKNTQ
jgi:ATP-dependent Clp protease ATP-binding subunit ClpB